MSPELSSLHKQIQRDVDVALTEDIGDGDVTAALIDTTESGRAVVFTRENAVLCGQDWFNQTFRSVDETVQIVWHKQDGDSLLADESICTVQGRARSLLTAERTALNFLQTLSATATATKSYVDAVNGTAARILDTRKTVPGLRVAQKYAVRCGGGENHRFGLYDGILIKENHISAAGSLAQAVQDGRKVARPGALFEVEVEDLTQLQEALAAGASRILLDNFTLNLLKEAVAITAGRAALEASGGITLENIHAVAATGVDYISVGAITKHIRAIDFSMRFVTERH